MIAMRQPHEFAIHMGAGLNNGLTLKEMRKFSSRRCHTLAILPSQRRWLLLPRLSRSVVWMSTKTTLGTAACFDTKRHPHCPLLNDSSREPRYVPISLASGNFRAKRDTSIGLKSWQTR